MNEDDIDVNETSSGTSLDDLIKKAYRSEPKDGKYTNELIGEENDRTRDTIEETQTDSKFKRSENGNDAEGALDEIIESRDPGAFSDDSGGEELNSESEADGGASDSGDNDSSDGLGEDAESSSEESSEEGETSEEDTSEASDTDTEEDGIEDFSEDSGEEEVEDLDDEEFSDDSDDELDDDSFDEDDDFEDEEDEIKTEEEIKEEGEEAQAAAQDVAVAAKKPKLAPNPNEALKAMRRDETSANKAKENAPEKIEEMDEELEEGLEDDTEALDDELDADSEDSIDNDEEPVEDSSDVTEEDSEIIEEEEVVDQTDAEIEEEEEETSEVETDAVRLDNAEKLDSKLAEYTRIIDEKFPKKEEELEIDSIENEEVNDEEEEEVEELSTEGILDNIRTSAYSTKVQLSKYNEARVIDRLKKAYEDIKELDNSDWADKDKFKLARLAKEFSPADINSHFKALTNLSKTDFLSDNKRLGLFMSFVTGGVKGRSLDLATSLLLTKDGSKSIGMFINNTTKAINELASYVDNSGKVVDGIDSNLENIMSGFEANGSNFIIDPLTYTNWRLDNEGIIHYILEKINDIESKLKGRKFTLIDRVKSFYDEEAKASLEEKKNFNKLITAIKSLVNFLKNVARCVRLADHAVLDVVYNLAFKTSNEIDYSEESFNSIAGITYNLLSEEASSFIDREINIEKERVSNITFLSSKDKLVNLINSKLSKLEEISDLAKKAIKYCESDTSSEDDVVTFFTEEANFINKNLTIDGKLDIEKLVINTELMNLITIANNWFNSEGLLLSENREVTLKPIDTILLNKLKSPVLIDSTYYEEAIIKSSVILPGEVFFGLILRENGLTYIRKFEDLKLERVSDIKNLTKEKKDLLCREINLTLVTVEAIKGLLKRSEEQIILANELININDVTLIKGLSNVYRTSNFVFDIVNYTARYLEALSRYVILKG